MGAYLRGLYNRTMKEAYADAHRAIGEAVSGNTLNILDCGAGNGGSLSQIHEQHGVALNRLHGIEWNAEEAHRGNANGIQVKQGDLNNPLPYEDDFFGAIYGLSVLEHLNLPCAWLQECLRTLKPGGRLIILTPNVSNYFTAVQLLLGRMPSCGPYPDSSYLVYEHQLTGVKDKPENTIEGETPLYRHLIVFSYKILEKYLRHIGFSKVTGRGYGIYPFPNFMQPFCEKLDPMHCHQMVFVCEK